MRSAVSILILAGLFLCGLNSPSRAAEVVTLAIGVKAPDFELPGVDGRTWGLADFAAAELLVFVFTANHCPTAQAYEERIIGLDRDFRDHGVALVMISPNDPQAVRLDELGYTDLGDSFEDMRIRAGDAGFEFPYLYDGDTQEMSRAYGPTATPHVFVFDRERKLRYAGRVDDNEKPDRVTVSDTRKAIEALLEGKPVPVETTRTFGCSIKWGDKRGSVVEAFERWAAEPVELAPVGLDGLREILANDTPNLRLINFWATWCGPCAVEFPDLVSINRMYRNREFEMITVSTDSPEKSGNVAAFLKKQQASCRNLLYDGDDKYALVEAVDSEWSGALPLTLLVAPGGQVIFRHEGQIDPLEVKKAIVNHLGRYYK